MAYVPLTDVWPRNGLLSVILGSLEDAGFSPVIECDPRGWMHYFRWPLGSTGTVTIWVREAELADALAFLAAPVEESWPADETCGSGLWTFASQNPRVLYGVWLAMVASGFFAL